MAKKAKGGKHRVKCRYCGRGFHVPRGEFPKAAVREHGPEVDTWAELVANNLDSDAGSGPSANAGLTRVPLDVRATAFQWKVWRYLLSIPPGSTLSYGEVAERMGRPGASRAVGNACASNPVAILIPCHRVIGTDGSLGGYRWGVRRKKAILEREGAKVTAKRDD